MYHPVSTGERHLGTNNGVYLRGDLGGAFCRQTASQNLVGHGFR